MEKRPPIGIMPKWLWLEFLEGKPSEIEIKNRVIALNKAINRYENAGFKPLKEWFFEIKQYNLPKD